MTNTKGNYLRTIMMGTLLLAGSVGQAQSSSYYNQAPHSTNEDLECYLAGGVLAKGVCVAATVTGQVAAVLNNDLRKHGGNETSVGDTVIEGDAKVSKNFANSRIKQIFITVSAIPKNQVLDYNEKDRRNFHNANRMRADGYVDRPWFLGSIGANIDISKSQDVTILAGSFAASGLSPLEGKPSRYYMTAPYGIQVRYDQGIQVNYELKEELDRVLLASFSVIDGDGVKGESNVTPFDSRANSYPSAAGTMEMRITNALRKVYAKSSPYLKNHDLYIGVTGSRGDTGSYPNQKRVQDDLTTYLGYMFTSSKGQAEVRVFRSQYVRNPEGNGDGTHTKLVNSNATGAEIAYRGLETDTCTWDFYYNQHVFDSESNDGEFTSGNVRGLKGWTLGSACRNLLGVKNLTVGVEYGEVTPKYKSGTKATTMAFGGKQFNLTFSYKFGLKRNYN
ncbi:hypothetical protein [Bdellovibrio sp. HCB288]|uniref:hypothetical protein n=1 Tax=Bdellovibrio sp. HCB288 TaxID=3394355 RepID=UPI0039B5D23C